MLGFTNRTYRCRQALRQEAAVLCLLAKIDGDGLSFDATTSTASSSENGKDSSITVVVQEGVEVRLPMAGQHEPNLQMHPVMLVLTTPCLTIT